MGRNTTHWRSSVAVIGLALVLTAWASATFGQAGGNPGVIPPNSAPYGMTYGQWTARWWQWGLGIPTPMNPLVDPANCGVGQSGPVWFLAGYTGGATPTCTVPAGMAILIPIINAECSLVEPPPFHGDNEAQLRACAKSLVDSVIDVAAAIDGVPVQNPSRYRVQSPLFAFSYPADNILGVTGPGTSMSVSDGYWLFLAPLAVGEHTISIHGNMPALSFVIDTTYHVTVAPRRP